MVEFWRWQLQQSPLITLALLGLLGAILGSFVNVVIYRLPLMVLGQTPLSSGKSFNLLLPASHCPHCQTPLKPWHNIPVFSWLWLRGRCAYCHTPIAIRYPLIEVMAGAMTIFAFIHFGMTGQTLAFCLFSLFLLTLAAIDQQHMLLPDTLTLPLLWLGLLINIPATFVPLTDAVLGAASGYLALWSVYWLFRLTTGKEGLGYGDFKLFAALGAWCGWQTLPLIALLAASTGVLVGSILIVLGRRQRQQPLAFGSYLAVAGWLVLIWGQQWLNAYLGYFKL